MNEEPDGNILRELTALREALVPVLALYSERDNVVCPGACIDHHSPRVEHVRVNQCQHASFGFNPRVLGLVAEQLASPLHA